MLPAYWVEVKSTRTSDVRTGGHASMRLALPAFAHRHPAIRARAFALVSALAPSAKAKP